MDRFIGDKDELCVVVMELYKVIKDVKYFNDVKVNFEGNDVVWVFLWDDNYVMCEVSELCLFWICFVII